jgi:serine protease inhibitor
MWFILPDADKTVNDVLTQGEYMSLVLERESENSKYMKVNFTVPKFDIGSSGDLSQGLRDMGITEVFSEDSADFSPVLVNHEGAYLGSVQQATRVAIDEDGVTAASYIVLPAAGAAMPPEEIIDFVLDRPFLFVIADSTGIPLFSGVVNQP